MTSSYLGGRLLAGGAWVLAGRLVTAGGSLIIPVLLTRLLAPDAVGAYFLAASVVVMAALLARGGLEKGILQVVAGSIARGHEQRARIALGKMFRLGVLGVSAVSILMLVGGGEVARRFLRSTLLAEVMPLLVPWMIFVAFEVLLADTHRAFGRIGSASVFGGALSRFLLIVALVAITMSGATATLTTVVLIVVATGWMAQMPAGWTAFRLGKGLRADGEDSISTAETLRVAWPLWVSAIVFYILVEAGLWIVSAFLEEADVALYGISMRLVLLVGMPLTIVDAVLPPFLAALLTEGSRDRLQMVIQTTATVSAIPALLALGSFVLFAPWLLAALFGEFYQAAGPVLIILSFGQIVNAISGSCGYLLIMAGYERDYLIGAVLGSFVTVFGGLLLVGPWGLLGVAVATTGGMAIAQLNGFAFARYRCGVWTHASPMVLMKLARREWRL